MSAQSVGVGGNMVDTLKIGSHVIIRAVYSPITKSPKPKHDARFCADTDYIGTTGIVSEIIGNQALVTIGLAHINGQAVHGSHKLVFEVGMLEAY